MIWYWDYWWAEEENTQKYYQSYRRGLLDFWTYIPVPNVCDWWCAGTCARWWAPPSPTCWWRRPPCSPWWSPRPRSGECRGQAGDTWHGLRHPQVRAQDQPHPRGGHQEAEEVRPRHWPRPQGGCPGGEGLLGPVPLLQNIQDRHSQVSRHRHQRFNLYFEEINYEMKFQ